MGRTCTRTAERQRVINNESVVSLDSTLTPELEWIINERMQKQTDAINQVRRAARMTWTEMETQRNLERYKLEVLVKKNMNIMFTIRI